MIKTLELKNFRKHEDLKVDFTLGLNVLRGPNESGKTTLTEAVLYALFGSKSLRDTMAETVTWGHKENELKVKLVIEVSEVEYTFTRSKAGAECNYHLSGQDSYKVVGQAEVASFAASVLGTDAKTASLLMLASQNGLRGALDDGPAAVSTLMGKLAEFDLIDQIVENANQKLQLGSTQPTLVKLGVAELEVQSAEQVLQSPDRRPELKAQIESTALELALYERQVADLELKIVDADEKLQDAKDLQAKKSAAETATGSLERRIAATQALLEEYRVKARQDVSWPAKLEELRKQLADAVDQSKVLADYKLFTSLPKYPEEYWEGTVESFNEASKAASELSGRLEGDTRQLVSDMANLTSKLMKQGRCPTCGHSKTSEEEVAAHNSAINQSIADVKARLDAAITALNEARAECDAYQKIQGLAKPFELAMSKLQARITVESDFYPPRLSWIGPAPTGNLDPKQIQATITRIEESIQFANQASGAVAVHQQSLITLREELAESVMHSTSIVVPEIEPLSKALDDLYKQHGEVVAAERNVKNLVQGWTQEIAEIDRVIADRQQRLEAAKARVAEYRDDIKALEFNNALVGKLKKLKPMITDHLWNTVLAAVSNFFSSLRGEQSVVTKDASGFRVNGRGVDSLSGSTLDVLALAIRVALTKTFIPHASFLILDEPAAGCDDSRTGNLLGFLASIGLPQVLIASHDELSESVSDNVILLGD